ncbi:MAG: polyhydroxyalkanoate synthesis repressor PhaR [Proteobacteria bacterium]|nr:MAG: polyhydroxyalkanoate synthesis repressor PhaR [Pseudomonadota bacterium]
MAGNELIVKKYGNRRLYDTEASQYITLDELATMLQGGRDVKVVDAKSGADLTKSVLLQIIAEQEKDRDLLPVAFLKQIVQFGDVSMRDALQRYLGFGLDTFLQAQKQMEQRYRDFAGSFLNPFGMFAPGQQPGPTGQGASSQPPIPQPATPPQPAPTPPAREEEAAPGSGPDSAEDAAASDDAAQRADLEQLKAQMAEMQKLLAKLGGGS